jgi:hypothetical protein
MLRLSLHAHATATNDDATTHASFWWYANATTGDDAIYDATGHATSLLLHAGLWWWWWRQ